MLPARGFVKTGLYTSGKIRLPPPLGLRFDPAWPGQARQARQARLQWRTKSEYVYDGRVMARRPDDGDSLSETELAELRRNLSLLSGPSVC
jgi:hypothetical protein